MDEKPLHSTELLKQGELKLPLNNATDVTTLVEGYVLQPGDDHDLWIGNLNLDLTNDFEQAILDITGALLSGHVVTLYPAHLKTQYAFEMELETLHFNK